MSTFGSFNSPYISNMEGNLGGWSLSPDAYKAAQGPSGTIPTLSKDQLGSLVSTLKLSPDYLRQVEFSSHTPVMQGRDDPNSESGAQIYSQNGYSDDALDRAFGDPTGFEDTHTGYYTGGGGRVTFADLRNALQKYGLPGSDQQTTPTPPPQAPTPYVPTFMHLNGIPYMNATPSQRGTPFGALAPGAGDQQQPVGVDWQKWMMGAGPSGSGSY